MGEDGYKEREIPVKRSSLERTVNRYIKLLGEGDVHRMRQHLFDLAKLEKASQHAHADGQNK